MEHQHEKGEKSPSNKESSHGPHGMWMMVLCMVPILIFLGGAALFGWDLGSWLPLLLVAGCFLGHMFMMKGHKH
jgi:hypothetical protein